MGSVGSVGIYSCFDAGDRGGDIADERGAADDDDDDADTLAGGALVMAAPVSLPSLLVVLNTLLPLLPTVPSPAAWLEALEDCWRWRWRTVAEGSVDGVDDEQLDEHVLVLDGGVRESATEADDGEPAAAVETPAAERRHTGFGRWRSGWKYFDCSWWNMGGTIESSRQHKIM